MSGHKHRYRPNGRSGEHNMGTDPIGKLLIRQAVPASIGILVMSLNILIDTIFVGQWIGANAIAAINVVLTGFFFYCRFGDVHRDGWRFNYFSGIREVMKRQGRTKSLGIKLTLTLISLRWVL